MFKANITKGKMRVTNIPKARAFGVDKIGTNPVPEQDRRTKEMIRRKVSEAY